LNPCDARILSDEALNWLKAVLIFFEIPGGGSLNRNPNVSPGIIISTESFPE
jgi:hypothetical protein